MAVLLEKDNTQREAEDLPNGNKKTHANMQINVGCGLDGTRTRDLLRDRQAF